MPVAEAAGYRINPFDLTKVWPHGDYPLIEVGRLTLNRNPDNYFGDVEQAGFDPGNFVPGIGPSPDKMLQGRLFAYGDAHRYRLGINHTQLPVNAPHATEAHNYGRDGADGRSRQRGPGEELRAQQLRGPGRDRSAATRPRWPPTAGRAPTTGTSGRPTTSARPVTCTGCSRTTPSSGWSTTSPGDWRRSPRPGR